MPDWLKIVAIALVLRMLYPMVMQIGNWLVLIRLPMWPIRLSRTDSDFEPTPLQLAMMTELESLGFRRIATRTRDVGPDSHQMLFFRHQSMPAFAVLTLEAEPCAAYPVVFASFDGQSNLLSTSNRAQSLVLVASAKIHWHDPCADSLAAHWDSHLARADVQHCKPVCNATAMAFLSAAIEANFTRLLASRSIVKSAEHWRYTVLGGIKLAIAMLRARKKFSNRYTSVLTEGAHQREYFAQCLIQQSKYKDRLPRRPGFKTMAQCASLLALIWLMCLALPLSISLAIIGSLLLHEAGHVAALRLLGYREISFLHFPTVDALARCSRTRIAAWKQSIIYLAGPLPGVLLGVAWLFWSPAESSLAGPFADWRAIAWIAILVNGIELLPFAALDGGRCLDLLFRQHQASAEASAFQRQTRPERISGRSVLSRYQAEPSGSSPLTSR